MGKENVSAETQKGIDMERLSIDEVIEHCKRNTQSWERAEKNRVRLGAKPRNFETDDMSDNVMKEYWEHRQVAEWLEQLKSYKDAEEQGLLLRLPCKVGDTIYRFWYVCDTPYRIQEQTIRTLSQVVAIMEDGSFGKSVFLTREEADKALAELSK